jgi:hypothetical protein
MPFGVIVPEKPFVFGEMVVTSRSILRGILLCGPVSAFLDYNPPFIGSYAIEHK